MHKTAFLFPGQTSQYPQMGKEFYEEEKKCHEIYECGSDICGFDIAKACFEASDTMLSKSMPGQLCIFATSLSALFCAQNKGIAFDAVSGHSLGEYTAMVASGMISMEDGFKLVKYRAEAMERASENAKGAMCAVIDCDNKIIEDVCNSLEGYAIISNYNSPIQTVIAGEVSALNEAVFKLYPHSRRMIKLAVNAAYHTKLMESAKDEFYENIKGFTFKTPHVDFYSNVMGKKLEDFSDMPKSLSEHLVTPVKFYQELLEMQNAGIKNFFEVGPNKVLSGLAKKTLSGCTVMYIENPKTLQKVADTMKI